MSLHGGFGVEVDACPSRALSWQTEQCHYERELAHVEFGVAAD